MAVLSRARRGDPWRDIRVSVGESSEDNPRLGRPELPVPTEAWIDAFDTQCTGAMLKRLRRYALLLARFPGGEYIADHAAYAEELVQTSLADLFGGALQWDPDARGLEPYLMDVIRLRARRDRKRARKYKHLSIDAGSPTEPSVLIQEMEARMSEHHPVPDDAAAIEMTRSLHQLREMADADPLALRFLEAIERNAMTRPEIMRLADLTRAEYHNTRRRLARLLARLPLGQCRESKEN